MKVAPMKVAPLLSPRIVELRRISFKKRRLGVGDIVMPIDVVDVIAETVDQEDKINA